MLLQFVIRNLKKRPFLNLVKVFGLALGLGGILFIALLLRYELSFDANHPNAKHIYRFTMTDPNFLGNAHFARIYDSGQIPALAQRFPEIRNYVRLTPVRGGVLWHNEKYYTVDEAFICDSTYFDLFEGEMLIGNRLSVLKTPGSMVLSESYARKVFGDQNPIGETLSIPAGQYYGVRSDFTITGVMKDYTSNNHLHPEVLATLPSGEMGGWAWTYLLLAPNCDPNKITEGCTDFWAERRQEPVEKITSQAYLEKLTAIHLHSDKLREIENNGNMTNLYVLAIASLILLLISMNNYASLNLGMAGFTGKFLAINRVLGSGRPMNLRYFLYEGLLVLALSVMICFIIVFPANMYISNHYQIDLFRGNGLFMIGLVALFCIFGLLAGIQPVFRQIIQRLSTNRETHLMQEGKMVLSKSIIVSQYAMAIVLIAGVLVISRQTRFVLEHSMGGRQNNIICLESVHANIQQNFGLFKSELIKHSSIESVSALLEPPGGEANDAFPFEMEGFENPDKTQKNLIGVIPCDYSFAEQFNFRFLGGTNFSKNNIDSEGSGEFIINKTALHLLNFSRPEEAIGKSFKITSPSPGIVIPSGKIIGVVEDFYLSSMKKKVNPYVLFKRDKLWLINFTISFQPGQRDAAIADLRNVWTDLFPAYPLNIEDVSSMYRKVYRSELLQAKLLSLFTLLSLVICSMGLLGLSLLIAQKRVKEIGIRKVNGARSGEVMLMLNRELLKWVLLSFVIATPIAWLAMHRWLELFAYRTELSWWIFALSGVLAFGIALLTVSWQSWKAAGTNPVEALKYE